MHTPDPANAQLDDSGYYCFAPIIPSLAIVGRTARFPVRRVYCIGRNYADHAREMGHDPEREPPFFFTKHADSVVPGGGAFPYPPATRDVHHEIELVVAIGAGGADIPVEAALDHVFGYAVGLDMTRRDLQAEAKRLGRPWEIAKAFDAAAPCSAIVPAGDIGHPQTGAIWLDVNGAPRQRGDIADMTWGVAELIAHLSRWMRLGAGDLIFTGTPAGVGPVQAGDRLEGGVDGVGRIVVEVGPAG